MIFRGRRFADAIERQLDLFERENSDLIERIDEAERAYDAADRDEAEERYSEFLDLVEIATDELDEMRDAFAATLDYEAAQDYEAAFRKSMRNRFRRFHV